MNILPIRSEQDYQCTLHKIEGLIMAEANTLEGERLNILVMLVEDYERKHYKLDLSIQ